MCAFKFQIYLLFEVYINLVIFQLDMLYMNCVCTLKACFKEIINNNLTNMRELIATNNGPYVSRLISYEQRTPILIMELKTLKRQHLTISDTVRMLNMIFSFQLLATIVITISNIIAGLYCYINVRQQSLPTISLKELSHVYILSFIAYYCIKIVLIVWACETGKNQAQQISTSIYDAFNNTTNEQIKDELQLFSLQIPHCNNTFSAKGLTVDAKLLTGIIGSIVTYLVILVQFIWDSCKEKTASNIA
ncbi:PREDICTED: putative gustatory receptor 23a, isoform B [Wasmannia auropunctata]|uniref:putative gustatory receptor 23a, isoform B n=1 Tax=Wasmannia auropunctata TaxID=64793 RepID=UPI0005F08BBE|nr:PREDICTED: putative gustatory receptor 23a, isoform B [Wasmannia auropunctata]